MRAALAYQRQHSEMTLTEGLAEHRRHIPDPVNEADLLPEQAALFRIRREFGVLRGTLLLLKELPRLWRTFRCARTMTRPWPFFGNEGYWQRPLREIRAEFGIVLP